MNLRFYRDYYARSKEPFERVKCTVAACGEAEVPCYDCLGCEKTCYETQLLLTIPNVDYTFTLLPDVNCTHFPGNRTLDCAYDATKTIDPLTFAPPIDRRRHRNLVLFNLSMAIYIFVWCTFFACATFLDCYKCLDDDSDEDE